VPVRPNESTATKTQFVAGSRTVTAPAHKPLVNSKGTFALYETGRTPVPVLHFTAFAKI
jgi:hypothetical protein